MSGHKLNENQQFDLPSSHDSESNQDVSGTKLGEVSELEQQLIEESVIDESDHNLSDGIVEVESKIEGADSQSDFSDQFDNELMDVFEGQIVEVIVGQITRSGVLVDFSYKSDGYIPFSERSDNLSNDLKDGDTFHAMVQKLETKEGYSLLSEKLAKAEMIWDDIALKMNQKEIVSVVIQKINNNVNTTITTTGR